MGTSSTVEKRKRIIKNKKTKYIWSNLKIILGQYRNNFPCSKIWLSNQHQKLPKWFKKGKKKKKINFCLQNVKCMRSRDLSFALVRFGIRSWRSLKNPCQPLLPNAPKILDIIVGPAGQIRRNPRPFVPKLRLQLYHHSPLFQGKLAPTKKISKKKTKKNHVTI